MLKPSDYQPHHMGDGKRFHVRTYNGGRWQVYGVGMLHVCECTDRDAAQMIADTLELVADIEEANADATPADDGFPAIRDPPR